MCHEYYVQWIIMCLFVHIHPSEGGKEVGTKKLASKKFIDSCCRQVYRRQVQKFSERGRVLCKTFLPFTDPWHWSPCSVCHAGLPDLCPLQSL